MLTPASARDWAGLGERRLRAGHIAEAIASFRSAAELEPTTALHWLRLGRAYVANWQHEAAESALERACKLDPTHAAPRLALADVLMQQNSAEAAIDACREALAAEPDSIPAAVAEALMLPPVYTGADNLKTWRNRFIDGLDRLHARKPQWLRQPRGVLGVEATNFYLAYQGEDDRPLQTSYSDFLADLLGAAVPDLQAPIAHRDRVGRTRVGFFSANLKVSTVGDYFGSWITGLSRDRFEVHTILAAGIPDKRTERFARASDRFIAVDGSVDQIATAVRQLHLDILVFLDVAMTPWGSLLINLRMAPLQCAAWGHPVTTGGTSVDYFLSCADMEPNGAAAYYRERLVLLPGLGTRYELPPRVEPFARERFGLSPHKRIYLCPQSLFKIHPDTDRLLLEILARDEEAILLFFAATTEGQRRAFVQRLEAGMKMLGLPPRQQIKLLPLMSNRDFRRVMAVADVMLDTLHWSGGRTSLDALAVGLPIVTLPGKFMRGRQSAAMLRAVGVEELIVHDGREYVELATRIARDRAYRETLASRIRGGLPRLVGRSEPIDALGEALESLSTRQPWAS